jgi:hypothetical protein
MPHLAPTSAPHCDPERNPECLVIGKIAASLWVTGFGPTAATHAAIAIFLIAATDPGSHNLE